MIFNFWDTMELRPSAKKEYKDLVDLFARDLMRRATRIARSEDASHIEGEHFERAYQQTTGPATQKEVIIGLCFDIMKTFGGVCLALSIRGFFGDQEEELKTVYFLVGLLGILLVLVGHTPRLKKRT